MQSARAHANHATPVVLATPVASHEALRTAVARAAGSASSDLCLLLRTRLDRRRLAPDSQVASAAQRGVRIRVIEEAGAATAPAWPGAEVRVVPRVPSRMLVADAALALVLPPTDGEGSAVAVGRSPLLATLTETFELLWESAAPAGSRDNPRHAARDTAILALLATGLGDVEVAARLGTSARTVRRRVGVLMREAGVSSRFQAGAEAVRRGWL